MPATAPASESKLDAARRGAERGDVTAQYWLAWTLRQQNGGVANPEAFQWLLRAAEQSHLRATEDLVACYARGDGVEVDQAQATKWCLRAAALGSSWALGMAGEWLIEGNGIERDTKRGVEMLSQAALTDEPSAMADYAAHLFEGKLVERNVEQAMSFARRSAEKGSPRGASLLGWVLALGSSGVERDTLEGERWLIEARKRGASVPGYMLRRLRLRHRLKVSPEAALQALNGVGWGLLLARLVAAPDRFHFEWLPVFLALGGLVALTLVGAGVMQVVASLNPRLARKWASSPAPQESESATRRTLARLLLGTPGEDGLFAVPLLLAGITPLHAAIAATVFGLLHCLRFSAAECVVKGLLYFGVLLWVLPQGLLSVVALHALIDVVSIFGGARMASRGAMETGATTRS